MQSPKKRLLVFVIAYYAESTLRTVLERLSPSIFEEFDCEILIVDDASQDRTFVIGTEYKRANPHVPVTVLRNGANQGYGGNQKVGYTFAAEKGFDFVAMVHGDGQYAPEEIGRLLQPLQRGEADAVFGSRMLDRFAALKGGMPLYKYVGNKVLTTVQNALLRSQLSEFHSGYRIYSVKALSRIPYRLNSNDFHFDTEIIIQLMNSGARIVELPIPTYYGDEICRVNGMKYAANVVWSTLQNVAHRSGLLYQRRFDIESEDNSHYDLKLDYDSSHRYALDAVPQGARVLDIGAGPGGLAQHLVKKGCRVTVVDQFPSPTSDPAIHVVVQNLDDPPAFNVADHEIILMLDIIEHLQDPERFMRRLREQFDFTPKRLILTTPNIAFIVQRLMLLLGQFNYGKAGILDRTHTRLFTFRSILRLLRDEGFKIRTVKGIPAPFPKALGDNPVGRGALMANLALLRLSRPLFAYQIYIEADTLPDVGFVLDEAKVSTAQYLTRAEVEANSGTPGRLS